MSIIINKDNLPYTGIALIVFAVIYYLILQNSYCNANTPLCKSPVIVSTRMEETRNPINKSAETLVQSVKCDILPQKDIPIFTPITNKTVAISSFVVALIFIIILINIIVVKPDTGFTDIAKKYGMDSTIIGIIFIIILLGTSGFTNLYSTGSEFKSIVMLTIIIVATLLGAWSHIDTTSVSRKQTEKEVYLELVVIIFVIWLTGFMDIYNLQFSALFNKYIIWLIVIIHIALISIMGFVLYTEHSDLLKTPNMFLIYGCILFFSILQVIMFGNRLYNCYWQTYTCEPEISIKRDGEYMEQELICKPNLSIGNDTLIFGGLAILFFILPSEHAVDAITDFIEYAKSWLDD